MMKTLPILVLAVAGLTSACTYRHETVQRPVPQATVVAAPAPAGTVVYTEPAPSTTTTTVYTR